VARGAALDPGTPEQGPEAFVDGLAALVAEEKERLKARLVSVDEAGDPGRAAMGETGELSDRLASLAFELAELRGRLESLQAGVDAVADRVDAIAAHLEV